MRLRQVDELGPVGPAALGELDLCRSAADQHPQIGRRHRPAVVERLGQLARDAPLKRTVIWPDQAGKLHAATDQSASFLQHFVRARGSTARIGRAVRAAPCRQDPSRSGRARRDLWRAMCAWITIVRKPGKIIVGKGEPSHTDIA